MELPSRVLMAPPDFFEVREVKNEFMRGHLGTVAREVATEQWEALRTAFESCGIAADLLTPLPQCEDMVFTANPSFNGVRANGERVCVPSRMAFTSRSPEVQAHREWFADHGYTIVELPQSILRCEGCGDLIWHPGRALIWAGSGPRTERPAHAAIADAFGVAVLSIKLADPRFYHLDTCFCALDERTVLIYAPAFDADGLALIRHVFASVIETGEPEATNFFACNAAAFMGGHVLMQSGAAKTMAELRRRGFETHEVDTGEFIKSGGSVFCMKAALF